MRAALSLAVVLCALAGAQTHAQTGPVIVIPGKVGVATTINGVIVDGAIVYGDWGLARPGHGQIIIEGPVGFSENNDSRGYFPATGRRPRVGRLEIQPPPRARPSTDYHREWSVKSYKRARPVTDYPPLDPPPVILAPRGHQ